MSNKDFLAQFQGAVSTLKSDGRLVSKGRSSSSASSSSSTRGGGRGGQTARRPPAQSLRVSTGARGGGGGGGGGQQSGVDVRNGSPKVRRAAAASARRGGPSHRPTVRDLEQFDADDRVAAAHGRFTSHSRSPQQRYQKHSHQQQVHQPPPVADSYYGGYHDSGSPDGRALPPQQEQFHHHHQPQQNLPQARHGSGSAHHGHGGGGGGGGGGGDFDDGGYSSGRSGGGSGHGHSSHGSGGGRSGGGAGGYYEGEDSSYYAPPPQRKLSSSTKSRKKQAPRQDDGAFRELSHLKQKDYKSDGLREKRLEKLVKTSKDQLKKARAVTDFKPKTLKDYKATKATGYQVIPSLQPDLEDPELVRKKAIKARQKEFSQRLNEVNRQVIQSAGPPKKKAAPKVVTKFDKMKEYAARVPKPKVQPIRPSPSAGAAGRSPGRRRRQDGGDDDDDDGYDDDEHMQAQSNIEQLLLMRENFAAEIEDMKREYTA